MTQAGNIQLRLSQLREASATLQTGANNVDSALQVVDQEMNQIGPDRYMTEAANSFRTEYQSARQRLMEAREVLNRFSQDLREAADIVENAARASG